MICSQCGNELSDNARFCSFCGNRVETELAVGEQTDISDYAVLDDDDILYDDTHLDSSPGNNGDSSESLENDSKISDQMWDNAVYVYKQGKDTIKCPKCGAKQTSAMNKCYRCGIRFVPAQNEGEEGQPTYVESDDATTMQNDMVKGYGNTTYVPAPVSAPKNDNVSVQESVPAVYRGPFVVTKKISNVMEVDEKRRLVKFIAHGASVMFGFKEKERIYRYQDIIGYELIENSGSVTKGGLGGAVAGGLMFGGAGAVAGSVLGKKSQYMCHDMSVRVTVNDPDNPMVNISILTQSVKTNSILYKSFRGIADSVISQLQYICSLNESDRASIAATPAAPSGQISAADEILKFKNLLDAGIITQAEFEKKKKELLGM